MLQNERPAASSGRRPYQFGNFYPGDKIALFLAHNLNNFKQFQTILNNLTVEIGSFETRADQAS